MNARARLAAIAAELRAIDAAAGDTTLTDEQQAQWDTLMEERGEPRDGDTPATGLYAEIERVEQRRASLAQLADVGSVESGDGASGAPAVKRSVDPFDMDVRRMSRGEARERAQSLIERERRVPVADEARRQLAQLVERSDIDDDGAVQFDGDYVARRMLLTEHPHYRSAFQKYITRGAGAVYTADEARAVAAFQDFEARSANEGTAASGGYGVPVMLDSTIILTAGAESAPILGVARRERVTTSVWKGVSSAGMSWSYDAEESEVSDDAPTLAQPQVQIYTPRGFLPYSIEVSMDYPGFAAEMGKLLDQGYLDLIAATSVTGSGAARPRGIFTALDANVASEVKTATAATFAAADVFKAWNALPERYRSRATWVMSVSVESQIRQFATNANASAYFTVDLTANGLSKINGRPVIITDSAPALATTTGSNLLAVGDFSNYLVAERAGMTVETVPLLVGANRRPTGQRGLFAWARHGMDSINDAGFRLLQVL